MTEFHRHEIEWTSEKVTRLWDFYATNRSVTSMYFGAQAGPAVARFIDDTIGFRRVRAFLDLSCGVGDLLAACLPFVSSNCRLVGVDFSPASVASASQRLQNAVPRPDLQHITTFPTPFHAADFDLIVMTEVVEHLDDAELATTLDEVLRLLEQGGHVVITTPNREDYDAAKVCCPECGCVFHRWQHRRVWTDTLLQDTMERAGFQTLLSRPIAWGNIQTQPVPLIKRLWRKLISSVIPLLPETGLVYVGRKP